MTDPAVAAVVEAADLGSVRASRPLGGGCIHDVALLETDGGPAVVKRASGAMAPMLAAEADGLRALARPGVLRVPRVLAEVEGALLLEHLPDGAPDWAAFGEALAAHHAADAGSDFGHAIDNYLGATPQPNTRGARWPSFFAERRLGHQLRLAEADGSLSSSVLRQLELLCARAAERLPDVHPSLIHGDLWSGNALPTTGAVAVIDPAVHVADGWCDIAMMRLFGGFGPRAYVAYEAAGDADDLGWRIPLYQLYHVLNHVHLFGGGYAAQASRLIARLL